MSEVNYGRIALIPKGDYSATAQYVAGDVVTYQNASYICKSKPAVGVLPTNTTYWQVAANANAAANAANTAAANANAATEECQSVLGDLTAGIAFEALGLTVVDGKVCQTYEKE